MGESNDNTGSKRTLGLTEGVVVTIGLTIGVGIFMTPKAILLYSGSPGMALIIWLVCGVLSAIGALSYVEMGLYFKKSGETYHYLDMMCGSFVAFLYQWIFTFLLRPMVNAIKFITFSKYLLQPFFHSCGIPGGSPETFAIVIAGFFTFLNCLNIKSVAKAQYFFSFVSVVMLLIISITGIVLMIQGKNEVDIFINPSDSEQGLPKLSDIALAIYSGIYTYSGSSAVNCILDDVKDPDVILPRTTLISVCLVSCLYMLTNMSLLAVLTRNEVIESAAIGVSFAQKALGSMSWIVPIGIALVICSTVNSGTLVMSRIMHVGSKRGHLPKILSLVHVQTKSPVPCIILLGILSVLYLLLLDDTTILKQLTVIANISTTVCVVSWVIYRIRYPNIQRTIKIPLIVPILYAIINVFLVTVTMLTDPNSFGWSSVIVLIIASVHYFIALVWKPRLPALEKKRDAFMCWTQKILFCVPQGDATAD